MIPVNPKNPNTASREPAGRKCFAESPILLMQLQLH